MPDHVFFSHDGEIVAECDLVLGAQNAGDDDDAQIVLPPQLCAGPLCKIELSVDGSVHVASRTAAPVFDAAGGGLP